MSYCNLVRCTSVVAMFIMLYGEGLPVLELFSSPESFKQYCYEVKCRLVVVYSVLSKFNSYLPTHLQTLHEQLDKDLKDRVTNITTKHDVRETGQR